MHADNPRIQPLLTLAEPDSFHMEDWPDYVKDYGITSEDEPDLLTLFADEALAALPDDRPEAWALLHAWRALGQLRSEAAIAPFIAHFDRLCHHDAALSELCIAVGMIGPAAIPPLAQHFLESDSEEFSRVLALDSLYEVAHQHPSTRDQVLVIYRAYVATLDTALLSLNTLLLGRLMALHATEAIAEIRQLFAMDCIDLTFAGDLEDVEIEMGLRDERETPKPDYAQWAREKGIYGPRDSDFSEDRDDQGTEVDPVFDTIDLYLQRYGSDESVLDVSELDGFFAALACAPVSIMPSTWMPALWGGETHLPEWENESDLMEFTDALYHHYNYVMGDFNANDYEPLFLHSTRVVTDVMVVDHWCEGFLRGLELWDAIKPEDNLLLEQWIAPIRFFGSEVGDVQRVEMTEEEIVEMQQRIQPNVISIRRHFFKPVKRANTTVVNISPKVGRNDPCPCGSGKKHKKCCGLH